MSRQAVVNQAKAWLGFKESDGSHKQIIDVYNSHKPLARGYAVKYTDAWCATFVSAVAIELGLTNIIPTECSCAKMIELFKKLGAWQENDGYIPSSGDVIFYDWQDNGSGDNTGHPDHVGYVESVTGGKITVIEGNYSNAVKRRILEVNGKNIRGYGVPKYNSVAIETDKTDSSDNVKYGIKIDATFERADADNVIAKLKAAGVDAVLVKVEGSAGSDDKVEATASSLKTGDIVRMQMNAPVYGKSYGFSGWVYNSILFVREVIGDKVVVSTKATGSITGAVDKKYLTKI